MVHVEVVVYGDPEVLDFSDFLYAFYVPEWETSLWFPVGALYGGSVDFPHCCFVERYYGTIVVVYFCAVVLRPLLDYR